MKKKSEKEKRSKREKEKELEKEMEIKKKNWKFFLTKNSIYVMLAIRQYKNNS